MNKLYFSLFCLFIITYVGKGQGEVMEFTLKEAQDYALLHNKTLLNARDDVAAAEWQLKEAKGKGLPQISASIDYSTNFNYEFEFGMGGGSDQSFLDAVAQLPDGTFDNGDMAILAMLDAAFSSSGSTIVMEDQSSANLQVGQLIFSGQYLAGIQLAKIGKMMAEKSLSINELDIKEGVMNGYLMIQISKKTLGVLKDTEKEIQALLKHQEAMYKVGVAEQTDVDQIKISLSQTQNTLRGMERNVLYLNKMLALVLGVDQNIALELIDDIDDYIASIENGLLEHNKLSIENNPTYQVVELQEKLGEKNIDLQKWAYAPTVSGYYTYKEKLMTTSFDLSPKNAAGLSLTLPIFEGGTKKAQVSRAKIELDKARRTKSLLEDQLRLSEEQFLYDLKNAYESYITQKEATALAKRVLDKNHEKYRQGLVSSFELSSSNSSYLGAQGNYVQSVMELVQAKIKLDKLYNSL